MKAVFADTSYWYALINWEDDLHSKAQMLSEQLGQAHLFTSELVFVEVLNSFSKDSYQKQAASCFVEEMLKNPFLTVVPTTRELFQAALGTYRTFHDKQWSVVDCASFEIMKNKKILEALTYDHHFEQAGFIALMRN